MTTTFFLKKIPRQTSHILFHDLSFVGEKYLLNSEHCDVIRTEGNDQSTIMTLVNSKSVQHCATSLIHMLTMKQNLKKVQNSNKLTYIQILLPFLMKHPLCQIQLQYS